MAVVRYLQELTFTTYIVVMLYRDQPVHSVEVPDLPAGNSCYARLGDLNIGHAAPLHAAGTITLCQDRPASENRIQRIEALKYAIQKVNSRTDYLPNITLGYVIVDDCSRDVASLAKSVYFLPDKKEPVLPKGTVTYCSEGFRHFDVVGVIGGSTSRKAVMLAPLLGVFHIPLISILATSDELSDKSRFEYFLRLSPPDRFQVTAMLDLLQHFNWSYISLVYSEGSYGEHAAKWVERETKEREMCLAFVGKIPSHATSEDMVSIMKNLKKNMNARVVILFASKNHIQMFFNSVKRNHFGGKFIWVGCDSMSFGDFGPSSDGALVIHHRKGNLAEFETYYQNMTAENNRGNPWVREVVQVAFNCEWNPTHGQNSCEPYKNTPFTHQHIYVSAYKVIEAVYVYAMALHRLIEDKCPQAFQNSSLARPCVKGPDLLRYLKKVEFQGITEYVKFDEAGDILGQYDIMQYSHGATFKNTKIATWNKDGNVLTVYKDMFNWTLYETFETESDTDIPLSICSRPCNKGESEYYFPKELPCCWECRKCRENERLFKNGTGCQRCVEFTWPDQTKMSCEPIPPTFLRWLDVLSLALILLSLFGITGSVVVSILFIVHRHTKLVKASSRELSAFIMAGILLAYISVFLFIAKPCRITCNVRRAGFGLSISLIYGPLLVKTNRIYRIFSAGNHGVQKPLFISPGSQVLVSVLIVLIQACVLLFTGLLKPPSAVLSMPVPTEEYVDLHCYLPLEGVIIPLVVNILLLMACSVYGFLTRKLPENFNESWYIFVSVSTTTFLWMVFIPTYFTTLRAYHQAALLAFCLIMNATVTLFCLYVPKIYAIYCVEESTLRFMYSVQSPGHDLQVLRAHNPHSNLYLRAPSTSCINVHSTSCHNAQSTSCVNDIR